MNIQDIRENREERKSKACIIVALSAYVSVLMAWYAVVWVIWKWAERY